MQTTNNNIAGIINEIASTIVLLEPDDIQALGDILKKLDSIKLDVIQDYLIQVKNVVERLILDEYESNSVGIDELSAAVEQMQLAFQESLHISDDELKKKQQLVDETDNDTKDDHKKHTIRLDDSDDHSKTSVIKEIEKPKKIEVQTEIIESDEDKQQPVQKELTSQGKPEVETTSNVKEEVTQKSNNILEHLDEDLESKEDLHSYFEHRDDPAIITQTIKDDPELIQGFLDETDEHLQMIENGLIDWESSPEDLTIIDSIFRPFHTIKGVSGFLNLSDINAFSHMYEDILDNVRKGLIQYSDYLSEAIFQGLDALREMISALVESQKQQKYVQHKVDIQYFIKKVLAVKKGVEHVSQFVELDDEDIENETNSDFKNEDDTDITDTSSTTTTQPPKQKSTSLEDMAASSRDTGGIKGSKAMGNRESSLRVSTGKMDSLIDLVGELVVTQNMVVQNDIIKKSTDKRLLQDVGQLKRITSNLQDLSMSLRMVPIKDTFQRMHRIIRDYSRKTGKKIVLEIRGEETEIDRNMVDELYDPLVHMIRNNCDHGIEYPDVRRGRGKPETGTITLNAYYKGGMVIIEVKDDGNGIDVDYVLKRSIKRGLTREGLNLTKNEILNFLFTSGFSTSEQVTDVSGRGVGLDVVKRAITNLRGNIEIETEKAKGSTFTLRLPLTLAIIDGVIVEIGAEPYIIPTVGIKESLVIQKENYNKIAGKGETVFIRNKILPLLRLDEYFGIPGAIKEPCEGLIIIVESDKQEAAILVDKMLDKQEIVIKSLGDSLSNISGLAGGAILSDGTVGLIVDIPTLLPKSHKTFKDY